jgi:hypothetical protein
MYRTCECGGPGELSDQDPSTRRFDIEGRNPGYPTQFRDGSSIGGLLVVRARVDGERVSESGFEVAGGKFVIT